MLGNRKLPHKLFLIRGCSPPSRRPSFLTTVSGKSSKKCEVLPKNNVPWTWKPMCRDTCGHCHIYRLEDEFRLSDFQGLWGIQLMSFQCVRIYRLRIGSDLLQGFARSVGATHQSLPKPNNKRFDLSWGRTSSHGSLSDNHVPSVSSRQFWGVSHFQTTTKFMRHFMKPH